MIAYNLHFRSLTCAYIVRRCRRQSKRGNGCDAGFETECVIQCHVQIEEGDTRYDARKNQLWWTIDLLDDSNRSGTLEFVVPACSPDTFLPVTVHFSSAGTLCDISVLSVTNTCTDAPAKYKLETQLFAEEYEIV